MSVVQQVKDRVDIVQYIQQHVPGLKKAGRYYKANCPFHNENTPSFVVNPDTQSWRCFGACAEGGDVFTFAQKMHGWSFSEALRELGQVAGVEVRKRSPQQQAHDEHRKRLRGLLDTAAQFYHQYLLSAEPQAQAALDYTRHKRGFTQQTIDDFQIGYAPPGWHNMLDALKDIGYKEADILESGLASRNERGRVYDRFRNRLMIPIRDERGRVIGFGARALDPDDHPKYLNSPQSELFDKSGTLFGLDRAKRAIRDSEVAVLVEGYMDVIQAHQAGYHNVVAQMGTTMTQAQLRLIAPRYAHKIIIALDSDDAGQNATRRSLQVAQQALQADYMGKMAVDMRVLQLQGAKDPDDVLRTSPELWPDYINNALPVAEFVINMETARLSTNASLQERQTIARNILPILTASENNLYTQDNIQKLALRLHIPEHDLLAWARELQQIEHARKAKSGPASATVDFVPAAAEDGVYSPAEEPPPFFGYGDEDGDAKWQTSATAPEDAAGAAQPQANRPAKQTATPLLPTRTSSRAAEAYCLRMLLLQPQMLSQINRKLRELAGNNPQLLDGPLSQLCLEDFSQGDYRALLDGLLAALDQDDLDLLDFLDNYLDEALWAEMQGLLLDEPDDLYRSIGQRLEGEFVDIWQQFERAVRPGIDQQADVIKRALEIRQQRLERERQEVRFLLEDAQRNHDKESEKLYYQQTVPALRALLLIQQELKRRVIEW